MDLWVGKDYVVTAVVFHDDSVEISFYEKRKQLERSAHMESIMIPSADYVDSLLAVGEELQDVIAEALLAERNPPAKLGPKERLAEQLRQEAEEREAEVLGSPEGPLE